MDNQTDLLAAFELDWKNKPSLSDLKADFSSAESSQQEHVKEIDAWLASIKNKTETETNYSKDNPFAKSQKQFKKNKIQSAIKSKLIRKQSEWRYISLSEPFLNTPDIFNVDPVTHADVEAAKQNGLVLNNQINNRLNKVTFIDELVRTFADEGIVFVKTGWDYSYHMEMVEYPKYQLVPASTQEQIAELDLASQANPDEVPPELLEAVQESMRQGRPMYPIQVGVDEVEEEVVDKNQPAWEVCAHENIYADPSCNGILEDASFVIHSYESSLAKLKKRKIYQNLDEIKDDNVIDDGTHKSNWAGSGFELQDKPRKKLVVYEYWGNWDINDDGTTRPIVATWVGNILIRLEENPFPGGELPFVSAPFMPRKKSLYGEPDAELLKENQDISTAVARGIVDLLGKSANSQTGTKKGALDPLNKKRFETGEDYEFNEAGDAQNSIYQHKFPEIPVSALNYLGMQSQEAESLTGKMAFNQGITGSGLGSTAAAANGALSAAAQRELGILRRLAELMKNIGRKFIAYNQEFLSEEEVVRITDKEFIQVKRDDLAGRFDLRLTISTAEADEQKASELSFMLQTLGPNDDPAMRRLIQAEIADLRKMPLLAQKIREFEPKPDPIAERLRELEIAEKEAEIALKQAQVQKTLAEAQVNGVKSNNVQADTDKKNLETIEQESGVAHARDIEKVEAQAESQARTKVLEAMLKPKTETKSK